MHILVITLLVVFNVHYATLMYKKCCDDDSHLIKNNSIYVCDKDENKRLQIFTNETDFLKNATQGTCLETSPDVTEYLMRNHTVVKETQISVNFYPKCCPLGYFYNSVAHSCVRQEKGDESFITQNFIKVGLVECKLIVDYNLTPGRYRMELGNLYIEETVIFQEGQFCVDKDENDSLIARGCHNDLSACYNGVKCIHKCCPDGQSFVNGQKCVDTYEHGLNLTFTDRVKDPQEPFAIIHRYNCRIYILQKRIQYYVDTDGTFFAYFNKTDSFLRFGIEDKSYCIEHIRKGKKNNFEFLMCFLDNEVPGKFVVAKWAKIISCLFIVLTVAVYLCLPEMLNLFGKILINYCASVLTIFILLAYGQFEINPSDKSCIITSFLSSYSSIASFSWLNVMCFDIWRTFATPKAFMTAKQKKSEFKRLLLYSLYGWGLPAVLTSLTILAYAVFNTPYVVKPIIGTYKCFWERRSGNYGMFLYYVIPLILLQIANFILFIRTVFYCLKVKGEINRMNDNRKSVKEKKKSFNVDKEQLVLILKLSITMGISFAFEVVSSLFNFSTNQATEYIEIIWDTINCLQGVFIFLIFICKGKVLQLFKNKFFETKDRKISVSSLPTGTTQTSENVISKLKV